MLTAHEDHFCALAANPDQWATEPQKWGKVQGYSSGMLSVTGFDFPVGSGAKILTESGDVVGAEVTGFNAGITYLAPFDQHAAIRVGALVKPVISAAQVSVGNGLLGRVVDPLGEPLDGKGAIVGEHQWPLMGRAENILNRGRITEPLDVGVQALNALLPIGSGQRVALVAGSGVGKTVLMRQLTAGSEVDVIVVGLIGERAREVSDFIAASAEAGIAEKMTMVAVPADHSPILRIKAAHRAAAIAEYFRSQGKSVLLMIDSLTRIAHAQREIGLGAGEPPTMKGYPPSAIGLIPQLLERAGRDKTTGGAITAFYTVLADGDDLDDPIVDAARAIADGHIILSRDLAEQGVYPAIDIGKSISRVAQDITDPDHAAALQHFRALWSTYQDNRDLITMGAYREGHNALLDESIVKRPDQLSFIKQSPNVHLERDVSIQALSEGFGQ